MCSRARISFSTNHTIPNNIHARSIVHNPRRISNKTLNFDWYRHESAQWKNTWPACQCSCFIWRFCFVWRARISPFTFGTKATPHTAASDTRVEFPESRLIPHTELHPLTWQTSANRIKAGKSSNCSKSRRQIVLLKNYFSLRRYECKTVFLNRGQLPKNGSWFHLDVHAPPRFVVTPEDVIYVNLADAIILNCQAEGTPTPEILWYKDANPVEPSATIGKTEPFQFIFFLLTRSRSFSIWNRYSKIEHKNDHSSYSSWHKL